MHHRSTPSCRNHLWTLCGLALILAAFVTGCEGKVVTPITPTPPTVPPTGGATNIEGDYQLTITASSVCSLPVEVKQRTYTARVTEAMGYVTVTLSGAEFAWGWDPDDILNQFRGTRNGDDLRFDLFSDGFSERVDGTKNLTYEGVADATIGDRTITGTFHGKIAYFVPGQQAALGICTAYNHRIAFVR